MQPTACSPSGSDATSRQPSFSPSPFPASVCSAARPSNVAAPFVPVDLDGVEIINNSELNLEQIAAMDPDLILARDIYLDGGPAGAAGRDRSNPADRCDGSWRDDLEQVAGLMQRTELLGARPRRVRRRGRRRESTRHADALASTPVAIVLYYPADLSFYAGDPRRLPAAGQHARSAASRVDRCAACACEIHPHDPASSRRWRRSTGRIGQSRTMQVSGSARD